MKIFATIITAAIIAISCNETKDRVVQTKLLAAFGDQPSLTKDLNNNIYIVFGEQESIYLSYSKDDGETFSEASKIAELKGLYLGYSSGPRIAISKDYSVVTAMNREGNYFSWTKHSSVEKWHGPVRVNDVDKSAGEVLGDLTATPDGKFYAVWIDTRILPDEMNAQADKEHNASPIAPKTEAELDKMTPHGITVRELYAQIGEIPENTRLSFFGGEDENILWVFIDSEGKAVKAENMDEYNKFKKRNAGRVKPKGKVYLSLSDDGGQTWSKSQLVYRSPEGSICECCKPSIASSADGALTIMFRNNIDGYRDLHFTKSSDGGKSFSAPEKLGSGTWKINACPMDGGGLMVNKAGEIMTVWQRKGEVFMASSGKAEQQIGKGRSPSIAANDQHTYIVYAAGENIMSLGPDDTMPVKIGTGSSPKVVTLANGALQLWVSEAGINYRKI